MSQSCWQRGLDLNATEETLELAPVQIFLPEALKVNDGRDGDNQALKPTDYGYVTLTRFAAQQLYAPMRLVSDLPGVVPEPVNDFETLTFAIYCTRSPVVGLGGLIQTASGSGLGSGHPRTKRSGCAAHAFSKMRRRCSIIACARPW